MTKVIDSVSRLLAFAVIGCAPTLAEAAKYDGSTAMICAAVLVHECVSGVVSADGEGYVMFGQCSLP